MRVATPLAIQCRCVERIRQYWPEFHVKRRDYLAEWRRQGKPIEQVTQRILEDLFTLPLDWSRSDLNHEVDAGNGKADILVTALGLRRLVVEAKHPGLLVGSAHALDEASHQAWRYADALRVPVIAVSDGLALWAWDIVHGGLRPRLIVPLGAQTPPDELWWLSVHGIYHQRTDTPAPLPSINDLEPAAPGQAAAQIAGERPDLLHPKYRLPARCFGYVGNAADPHTWKLPYLQADGHVDASRLPGAIRAVLTNYRGERVKEVPEQAVPDVLVRLAQAAHHMGKLLLPGDDSPDTYKSLANALDRLGRLKEVTGQ